MGKGPILILICLALVLTAHVRAAKSAPPDFAGAGPQSIFECQVIDQSGLYEVQNNLPGVDGLLSAGEGGVAVEDDCLVITVDAVTIEGNGFRMDGPGKLSGTSGSGIRTSASSEGITIRNILISGFDDGVQLPSSFFVTIDNVTSYGNAHVGISITGGTDCQVTNNTAVSNEHNGIEVSSQCRVLNNLSSGNLRGIVGPNATTGHIVMGNTTNLNSLEGLTFPCPSLIINNVATDNDLAVTGVGDIDLVDPADCISENNVITPP